MADEFSKLFYAATPTPQAPVQRQQPDEKPDRFVTLDQEALHAATIRGLCTALNDAVKAAAKDGLRVEYRAGYADDWSIWSAQEDEAAPTSLTPTIMRKL